jgi:hypothetical protein
MRGLSGTLTATTDCAGLSAVHKEVAIVIFERKQKRMDGCGRRQAKGSEFCRTGFKP